jgi:Flp pilus assembly protein TadG
VLVAIILPFLVALLFTCIEIGSRMLQRQQVEDALRQASRSSVQIFSYEAFANNTQSLGALTPGSVLTSCSGSVAANGGCDGNDVAEKAAEIFAINLQHVGGLTQTPEAIAQTAQWTVLKTNGACGGQTYNTPAVCATLNISMKPIVPFMGNWTPNIQAAETIDRIDQ